MGVPEVGTQNTAFLGTLDYASLPSNPADNSASYAWSCGFETLTGKQLSCKIHRYTESL